MAKGSQNAEDNVCTSSCDHLRARPEQPQIEDSRPGRWSEGGLMCPPVPRKQGARTSRTPCAGQVFFFAPRRDNHLYAVMC